MKYTFKEKTYDDLFVLAKDLYSDSSWVDEVRKDEFLSFVDERDEIKAKKIKELLISSLPEDVFVFKIGEILNPFMSIRINNRCYKDYKELGESILSFSPIPDNTLQTLLRYELISEHMRLSNYMSLHKEEYQKVKEIEKIGYKDIVYAYYSMGYYLSKATYIIFDKVLYKDLYNFMYFILKKETDLNSLGKYLSSSPLLKAYGEYTSCKEEIEYYFHLVHEEEQSENKLNDFLSKRRGETSKN